VIAVLTPDKGASRLLQAPADDRPVPQAKGLSLNTVDYDEKGELVLSGRAQPGTTVQVYVNNEPVGAATADSQGRWQLQPAQVVPPGVYTLRVDQVADTGKVASRLEVPFQRAALADLAEREGSVIVQPGNSLWRIARRHYGAGTRYTTIYGANQDQIRDPDRIYPGQVFALPKVAQ
jgi:nucleoid-associated protein YgaU